MSELVTRVAENVGIETATAEKAVGMILGFLQREAAEGPVAQMIEAIPGAPELVAQYNGEGSNGGGLLGGLMSAIGGGGGVMALGQQLMSQGLGMERSRRSPRDDRICQGEGGRRSRRRGGRLRSGPQPVRLMAPRSMPPLACRPEGRPECLPLTHPIREQDPAD